MVNVFYLLGAIFCGYISILYKSPAATAAFVFFLCIPIPAWLLARNLSKQLEITAALPIHTANTNEGLPFSIQIKNKGLLPVSCVRFTVEYENLLDAKEEYQDYFMAVPARDTARLSCLLSSKACGKVHISVSSPKVYDYFHLFSFRISQPPLFEAVFLPQVYPCSLTLSSSFASFEGETLGYHPQRKGNDPSELLGTHVFAPGDKLQRVHWKLSAKTGQMLVKDFAQPITCSTVLFLDWHYSKKRVTTQILHAFLEITFSLVCAFIHTRCPLYISWFDSSKKELVRFLITEEEELYSLALPLFEAKADSIQQDIIALYKARYPTEPYHTSLSLDLNLNLTKNGELLSSFHPETVKEELLSLSIVV